jgi:Na+/proline symporter
MPEWAIILLICGLYLALVLGLGVGAGRTVSASVDGYVAGDRTLGVVVLYFVLGASVFSSFAFLGAPGWAYSRGAAAFYIIAYGTVGMVPFYFWGPAPGRSARRSDSSPRRRCWLTATTAARSRWSWPCSASSPSCPTSRYR